jgi:hypothetical protein
MIKREISSISLLRRALIAFMSVPPHDLNTSQRSYLLMPSIIRLGCEFEGGRNFQTVTAIFPLSFMLGLQLLLLPVFCSFICFAFKLMDFNLYPSIPTYMYD